MGCNFSSLSSLSTEGSKLFTRSRKGPSYEASHRESMNEVELKILPPYVLSSYSDSTLVPSAPNSPCRSRPLSSSPSAQHVTSQIRSLLSGLKSLQSHLKTSATENLSAITAILSTIPESSFQARSTLMKLHALLSEVYNRQYALVDDKTMQRIPLWWNTFVSLPLDSQRRIAKRLPENSLPMLMMAALSSLRTASEDQRALDMEVQKCIDSAWETVMSDLKMRELEGKDNGGMGVQWRVFGICCEQRRAKASERAESVARKRVRASGALVEYLEGLEDVEA